MSITCLVPFSSYPFSLACNAGTWRRDRISQLCPHLWYWLVDGLMAAGYRVHLANTTPIEQYKGLEHTDDEYDVGNMK